MSPRQKPHVAIATVSIHRPPLRSHSPCTTRPASPPSYTHTRLSLRPRAVRAP
ncbi:hypothetical protein C2E23DRAFT_805778 [Lenzites betulinus]|nr:hypothetical protein C2E23DRAFT_805778 [Lenzites betulinus]